MFMGEEKEVNAKENSPAKEETPVNDSGETAGETPEKTPEELAAEKAALNPIGPSNPAHKWYVVHVYSGYEHHARRSLEERVCSLKATSMVSEIVVPEESVVSLVKGKRRVTKRRFFPGYILVRMELSDQSWHLLKDTPKITGFVGDKRKPLPISEAEMKRMTNRMEDGVSRPRPKVSFIEGESIRVIDGPFINFNGTVDLVNSEKSKVRVLVSIFGRSTPVELDFVQVEKV